MLFTFDLSTMNITSVFLNVTVPSLCLSGFQFFSYENLPSLYNAQLTIIPPLSSAGLPVTPLQIGTSVRLTCLPFCQKNLGCPTFTFHFFFLLFQSPWSPNFHFFRSKSWIAPPFNFLPKSTAAPLSLFNFCQNPMLPDYHL